MRVEADQLAAVPMAALPATARLHVPRLSRHMPRQGTHVAVRRGSVRTAFERYHGFIAAVLTVVAAGLGAVLVVVGASNNELSDDAEGLRRQAGALEEKVRLRDATIDTLEESNKKLAQDLQARDRQLAELGAAPDGSGATVGDTPRAPAVRHQGRVTLAAGGDSINLEAPASDVTWASGQTDAADPGLLLYSSSGNLVFGYDVGLLALGAGQVASFDTCSVATGYSGNLSGSDPGNFQGTNICRLSTVEGVVAGWMVAGASVPG